MKKLFIVLLFIPNFLFGQIELDKQLNPFKTSFPIVGNNAVASVYYDTNDFDVVKKSAYLFVQDIVRVTGKKADIISSRNQSKKNIIIIGTIGKNRLIDELIAKKKINVDSINGQWEKFIVQIVLHPFPRIKQALVIAGSDKRGTAYGTFTLSETIGVSPWYWWADVPIQKSKTLYLATNKYISKSPSVKYRGIFLNDEDWGLHPWAAKNMDTELGDIGPKTYEKVFELLLRLKANMVAPAMHECTKAFYSVPGNMEMAENYGLIVTTSHCEPLLYNNASEWDKKTQGDWNYETNRAEIVKTLDKRVGQAHENDNIYTIALRGMHDEGMVGGTDDEKLKVLDVAVKDQRSILSKNINKPLTDIPQIFVPYKEVLSIYEKGLKLPDDITIVWPDDNYGYIKKLSNSEEQKRSGESGVYYHISYLGWPNDYLWLNTTPPALMYAEMQKAYSLGATRYWLLNVGDIKPGEMGVQLFLDMAWDMDQFNFENINKYQVNQLVSIFGDNYKNDIEKILERYYFNGFTRKPEFMTWDWRWNSLFQYEKVRDTEFSFINYSEAENRLNDYNTIATKAEFIYNNLPAEKKTSFFELVYYPVKAASLYNHEMLTGQKNRWYAKQGRAMTNALANEVKLYHDSLAMITAQYNNLLNGKWKGMMVAPGFLPKVQLSPTKQIDLPAISEKEIFVEGQTTDSLKNLSLPQFNKNLNDIHYFEVYNKGTIPFEWTATPSESWIKLDKYKGRTVQQDRILVSVDWSKTNLDELSKGEIIISDGKITRKIAVMVLNTQTQLIQDLSTLYLENNGVISICPTQYIRKTENKDITFQAIEGLGYTKSALQLGSAKYDSGENSFVEYDFYANKTREITVYTYMLPLFAKDKSHSTRYGIQLDNQETAIIQNDVKEYSNEWAVNVLRNSTRNKTKLMIDKPGKHTLKLYCIDPGMIIQKIIIDFGGLKDSYLGPEPL
ncbi:MAG: glycosyl hydrolase 115 family protein [Paludibacter sp.]|nr:glycosyl hydrolase 115 family protein [Paludibacter sp.]